MQTKQTFHRQYNNNKNASTQYSFSSLLVGLMQGMYMAYTCT